MINAFSMRSRGKYMSTLKNGVIVKAGRLARALAGIFLAMLSMLSTAILYFITACVSIFVFRGRKEFLVHYSYVSYSYFCRSLLWILKNPYLSFLEVEMNIDNSENLTPEKHCIVMSNHISIFDIALMGSCINEMANPPRFFMKQSLMWKLPLAGHVCYFMGFPIIKRKSYFTESDKEKVREYNAQITRDACAASREMPSTLLIYPEGTRYTEEKYKKQKNPKFKHLLNPQLNGLKWAIEGLSGVCDLLVNATIMYSKKPSVSAVLEGRIKVFVRIRMYEIPKWASSKSDEINALERKHAKRSFMQWVDHIWSDGDIWIDELKSKAIDAR